MTTQQTLLKDCSTIQHFDVGKLKQFEGIEDDEIVNLLSTKKYFRSVTIFFISKLKEFLPE